MEIENSWPWTFINILVARGKLGGLKTCHSPFFSMFRNINGILQDLTSFGLKFSTPECSSIIPVKISPMLFQRLYTSISMLLGPVPIKITANLGNGSKFGLYDLTYPSKFINYNDQILYPIRLYHALPPRGGVLKGHAQIQLEQSVSLSAQKVRHFSMAKY